MALGDFDRNVDGAGGSGADHDAAPVCKRAPTDGFASAGGAMSGAAPMRPIDNRYDCLSVQLAPNPAAAPPAAKLHVQPTVDFGDVAIGGKATREVYMSNTHEVFVEVRLVGNDGSFRMDGAPTRLASETSTDPYAIKSGKVELFYMPQTPGSHHASLVVTTKAIALGSPVIETVTIPIKALAHRPGETTAAQHAACEAEDQEEAATRARLAARQVTVDKMVGEMEAGTAPPPDGQLAKFQLVEKAALRKVRKVFEQQKVGVGAAASNADDYIKKAKPAPKPHWLWDLAEMALNAATAGIAEGVASKLAPKLLKNAATTVVNPVHSDMPAGTKVATDPSEEVIGGFTEKVKATLEMGTSYLRGVIAGGGDDDGAAPPERDNKPGAMSSNPVKEFFAMQAKSLADSADEREGLMERDVYELRPLLRTNPKGAIAAVQALAESLDGEAEHAALKQQQQTVLRFIELMARMSLGTIETAKAKDACGDDVAAATRTDMRGATHAPREHDAPTQFTGLIDLVFDGDALGYKPVVLKRAQVSGMTQEIADVIAGATDAEGRLIIVDMLRQIPIRAYGEPTPEQHLAVLPVTVTRDEAGTVLVHGDLRWLSNHGGVRNDPDQDAAVAGGRRVLAELEQQLVQRGKDGLDGTTKGKPRAPRPIDIHTDDATGRGG